MRGSREVQWVSLEMFVALALVSIAVYLTGSPASHQLQKIGVSHEIIHRHSQSADFSFTAIEVLGAMSLAILVKFRITHQIPTRFGTAWLALALVTLGLLAWTATLGGRIRHPEVEKPLVESTMKLRGNIGISFRRTSCDNYSA